MYKNTYIVLSLIGLICRVLSGVVMAQELLFNLVTIIGPLILAVTVHEYAHIAMARALGDDLGSRLGRFTLDPLKHIDPMWTVGLPVALVVMSTLSGASGIPFFAAGKPAPYNPLALKGQIFGRSLSVRACEMLVALAGPISNLVMALISLLVALALVRNGYEMGGYGLGRLLMQFVYLNVALFVFNLIPIPPLDGAKVFTFLLPAKVALRYESIAASMGWLVLIFIIFGGGAFIGSMVQFVVSGMVHVLT